MENLILSSIPFNELKEAIRGIVTDVVKEQSQKSKDAEFLSPEQTMQLFSPAISRSTLSNWSKDGTLIMHRIGGKIFYKRGDVIAAAAIVKRYKKVAETK